MIEDGLLNVQIRTLNSGGTPVSVATLVGIVKNSLGEEVDRFDLTNLTETAVGVYEHEEYDVSDPELFPGSTMSIFWYTCDEGVSPERTFDYYNFYPNAPARVNNRLITWSPVYGRIFTYQIERKRPSETDYSIVGYATSNYFIDPSTYTGSSEYYSSLWRVRALGHGTFVEPSPYIKADAQHVCLWETEMDFCTVSGIVTDVIGRPSNSQSLYFYVDEKDAPMSIKSTLFLRRNEVAVHLNSQGAFAVPLVQGLIVTCELPDAGVAGKFLVPKQKHVQFSSLDLIPVERYRGQ